MPEPKKQKYYQENRNKRLGYQKKYYFKNKSWIKRKRELRQDSDLEWVKKVRKYNSEYYMRNRDRIREKRAERLAKSDVWAVLPFALRNYKRRSESQKG